MLMSSFVGLTSLYGCGADCDGATLKTCVEGASGTTGTTAPNLTDFLSDLTDLKKTCDDAQKLLDCYDGRCCCTCAELKTEGGADCEKDDETVKDRVEASVTAFDAVCTGDNEVTNPCPNDVCTTTTTTTTNAI
jgi:hypothetical protein